MIRIKESIAYAKSNGQKVKKIDLAKEIWPNSPKKAAYMNLLNLETGRTRKVDDEVVNKLCDRLKVTADYLFGRSEFPDEKRAVSEAKDNINNLADNIKEIVNKF